MLTKPRFITQEQRSSEERAESDSAISTSRHYPTEVTYYCKIHQREETAVLRGITGIDELELALYDTPAGNTLNHRMVEQLANGTLPDEIWKQHGWNGQ